MTRIKRIVAVFLPVKIRVIRVVRVQKIFRQGENLSPAKGPQQKRTEKMEDFFSVFLCSLLFKKLRFFSNFGCATAYCAFEFKVMCRKKFIKQNVFVLITTLGAILSPGFSQYRTLGTGSCGLGQSNCHTSENNWWKDDAHHATVDAFYDDPTAYEKIAQLAGVGAGNMLKGNQSCASCHATVVSGKEAREVEEGVSCESCHGAGSGYKDPHSEKPGGYEKALKLGLVELKKVDTRGEACVRCHYITDQKLLAAGHPDGASFNYISGIKKVAKHWKRPPAGDDLVKTPFEKAMRAKGPVAQIVKVEPVAAAAPAAEPAAKAVVASAPPAKPVAVATPKAARTEAPAASNPKPIAPKAPAMPPPTSTAVPLPAEEPAPAMRLDLPPFPSISDTASVREILMIVKKRLELLYQKTGQ